MANFSWLWSEKLHKAWEVKRTKGALRFVLMDGLAAWGGPMFLIMSGGPVFFGFPYKVTPSPSFWLFQVALWAGAGLLYGVATWHVSERQFAKHVRSAP